MRRRFIILASHSKSPISVLAVVLALGSAVPASAETLKQALAAAYRNNPVLEAQRARLRATDEGVAVATSAYLPRVSAQGGLAWEETTVSQDGSGTPLVVGPTGNISSGGVNRSARYGVVLTQPIFTGFQTTNTVRIAEANVRAGRETLRDTERSVLLRAIAAYADVISFQRILRLQEQNLSSMDRHVKSARERLAFNELTNTDVSQAMVRMSSASSAVAAARGDLKSARGAYFTIIGHEPSGLVDPPLPRNLPKSLNEALAIAGRENPIIINAIHGEEASRYSVDLARGRLLPTVGMGASWSDEYNSQGVSNRRSVAVVGSLSVPLYEGGEVRAQIRQAKQLHLSQIQAIEAARGEILQAVTAAWAQLDSTRASLAFSREAIKASEAALIGVRKEESLGQRSLLDVLNAEQDVRSAQITLVLVQRNYIVSAYQLLGQIGRLEAGLLDFAATIYDPTVYYDEVNSRWRSLTITYPDGRRDTMK